MTGEQRGLLIADLERLRQQKDDALHRAAEAAQARSRAKELVYAAQAQVDSANLDAELLLIEIDQQLEALKESEQDG